VAALLLITNLVRSDVVGMLVILTLQLTGVLTLEEALSGFSNQAVLIIAAMFLVSEAIVHTGIGQRIGDFITQKVAPVRNGWWFYSWLPLACLALS